MCNSRLILSTSTPSRRRFDAEASKTKTHFLPTFEPDGVTDMSLMFYSASAFDQDLGWCVADGVNLDFAFTNTPCASTSCGVTQGSCPP